MGERESSCVRYLENRVLPKIGSPTLKSLKFENAEAVRRACEKQGIMYPIRFSKPKEEVKTEPPKERKKSTYRKLSVKEAKRVNAYIKEHIGTDSLKEISEKLKLSKTTIKYRAKKLGLR